MCGRIVVKALKGMIAARVRAGGPPGLIPHFNIAPTGELVTIQADPHEWEARIRKWGLIPSWAKDATIGAKTFNARAETIAEKPSFRTAFQKHRCLIPVDGFYEWASLGKGKTPFFISHVDPTEMLVFAGLFESWRGPEGAVETCTVITTEANELMKELHTRMPVVLNPEDWDAWLSPGAPKLDLLNMLKPLEEDSLQAWQVNPLRGDGPDLIRQVV